MTNQILNIQVQFPLADGRTLVEGPLTYNADGFATKHSADFIKEPRFAKAYALGMASGHPFGPNLHVEWRVYLPCWAAAVASRLEGDFVECGVASGMVSLAVCSYVGFERMKDRTFYLLDTYEGFPINQLSEAEREKGLDTHYGPAYGDTYELVKYNFRNYPNVRIVKGMVPDTLEQIKSEKIAYLMLDMNAAAPERAAIEYCWDRLTPGAMVVLDDYGWDIHVNQKRTLDEFAAEHGVEIFTVPSGQGLLIKPPR